MSYIEKEFHRLAGKAVHQYGMIKEGDRILVGLSGGKDSLALLHFLEDRRRRIPIDYTLVAAHINLGYERPEDSDLLREHVRNLGVDHHFETTDYAPVAHSRANRENPCFLCSRLRRRRLFELARDYGCAKIALGHHRDDLVETLLLNIFYSGEISTMMPYQEFFKGLVTIIRPLVFLPEDKIQRFARELGLPVVANACPSSGDSKRTEVKEIISQLSRSNDKIKGNIFRSLSNYRPDYLLGAGRAAVADPHDDLSSKTLKEATAMKDEQRSRKRVRFQTSVTLEGGGKVLERLESRDISLKGLFVATGERLPADTLVAITLHLAGASSTLNLNIKGRVARIVPEGMAIDFVEIDLDSFYHLRNIISYNSGDPNDVDSELATKPAF